MLFIPGDAAAQGEIRNTNSHKCIDIDEMHKPIGLWPCHGQGGNQHCFLSNTGEIRRDSACMDYGST